MNKLIWLALACCIVLLTLNLPFDFATVQANTLAAPTPRPSLTPITGQTQSAVEWENATLDQVQFSDPKIILSQNAQIKIWSWLSDNKRLLAELEDPTSQQVETRFRIVTLDTESGEILEYGRRRNLGSPPLWHERTQTITFSWQEFLGLSPQIRVGRIGGHVQIAVQALASYTVNSNSGEAFYRVASGMPTILGSFNLESPTPTPSYRYLGLALPLGAPLVNQAGTQLAIVGSPTWGMLDLDTARLRTFPSLAPAEQNSEAGPVTQGTGNEQWSPNGKQIAFLQVIQSVENRFRGESLALLDSLTTTVLPVSLPINDFMELDWSPASRFILARGGDPETLELYPNSYWLVDSNTRESIMLDYFPRTADAGSTLLAWSADGKIAWVKNVPEGLGIAITQTTLQK
jgi:hypothetical protein